MFQRLVIIIIIIICTKSNNRASKYMKQKLTKRKIGKFTITAADFILLMVIDGVIGHKFSQNTENLNTTTYFLE